MRLAVSVLAMAALVAAAPAGMAEPISKAREKALVDYYAHLAVTASTMGACEQYLDKASVDRNLEVLLLGGEKGGAQVVQMRALFARMYAQGRRDADSWSAEDCASQLKRDYEDMLIKRKAAGL